MSKPCSTCGGKGTITVTDRSGETVEVDCGTCGGRGTVRSEED
jgi:DnaJ-class molecular chaperone